MKPRTRTLAAVLLLSVALLLIACAHRVGSTTPITPWENIHVTNAEIASVNNSVAQGLIAANQAGALETEYTAQVTQLNFNVAAWQKELTPLLKDQATATANSARVKQLINGISQSAAKLISSGNAGVKNPQAAAPLTQAISSLSATAGNLYQLLQTTGVLK
ncbi:MAG TPA: hypothetical protein VKY85_01390 [Candidatus Angelobacter sp.]|nr:hypothetical protein [Candidatus Angelobacter sp.]